MSKGQVLGACIPKCYKTSVKNLHTFSVVRAHHRYLKNIDCLSFVVWLLLAPHLPRHFPFFAEAINGPNGANKAGGTCH
jgi:hypothetical protein